MFVLNVLVFKVRFECMISFGLEARSLSPGISNDSTVLMVTRPGYEKAAGYYVVVLFI